MGYRSIGVRFIDWYETSKLKHTLTNFSISHEIEDWEVLSEQEKADEMNQYLPNLMQLRVTDYPIPSQTTKNDHISIDRVAAIITSKAGKIEIHYLGAVHRFDKRPYGSEPMPICLQGHTAFTEKFTDNQHQEMQSFIQKAMKTMYCNELSIPPNLYSSGSTDKINGQQINLEDYFTQ